MMRAGNQRRTQPDGVEEKWAKRRKKNTDIASKQQQRIERTTIVSSASRGGSFHLVANAA
jgi:hypothetical protein